MKRFTLIYSILGFVFCAAAFTFQPAAAQTPSPDPEATGTKTTDLVLIHGLANKHKWSRNFLEACLKLWGSGHVFVIYTGQGTPVTTSMIQDRQLIYAGGKKDAGTGSVEIQAAKIKELVNVLQKEYGLRAPFSIIAHSMGGLVARQYSHVNPGMVAGLVTLGTPHQGSPLANSFQWVGFFMGAREAIEDLKPKNAGRFNSQYPAAETPLAMSDRFHTIRGTPDETDCYGWAGELFFGWQILYRLYGTRSDGLVPYDSARIEGSNHIADFAHYDHYDLVRKADVAREAAQFLP